MPPVGTAVVGLIAPAAVPNGSADVDGLIPVPAPGVSVLTSTGAGVCQPLCDDVDGLPVSPAAAASVLGGALSRGVRVAWLAPLPAVSPSTNRAASGIDRPASWAGGIRRGNGRWAGNRGQNRGIRMVSGGGWRTSARAGGRRARPVPSAGRRRAAPGR